MIGALLVGILAWALSFAGLTLVEKLIHKLTKNPDRSYTWGVWLFSILIGIYTFATSLGR